MVTEFALGDTLTLRKPHPCGGTAWRVERLGADIGVRCLTCGHSLLRTRPHPPPPPPPPPQGRQPPTGLPVRLISHLVGTGLKPVLSPSALRAS
ncbi:MAG: DUF951 domain-containing protein [Dehalococcoidia bacterium]|nr:DUF951 domain-containing protein [Dehalococcoidia bacterium]